MAVEAASVESVHGQDALSFWRNFVVRRQPAQITSLPSDAGWKVSPERWTEEYLTKAAGEANVFVEQRDPKGSFGLGRKVEMTFGDFLKQTAAGNHTHYLSTQAVGVDQSDGHPELFAPPMSLLHDDFPLQPCIMGNLIPQQINMWMGHSPSGSSSGLHHDFHDNLYVLIRGRKHFELYSPDLAERMYTAGVIRKVHCNGRIVYEGQGDILASGCEAAEAARWHAEERLAAAEGDAAAGIAGADDRLEAAEQALDALMHASLADDRACDVQQEDDYIVSDDDTDDIQGKGHAEDASPAASAAALKSSPPNFSSIEVVKTDAQLRRTHPLFPGRCHAVTCSLEAGQMLYLPAGWFHCVTSHSLPGTRSHLAVNYWFHPPDNLDPGPQGFSRPYTQQCYWPALWARRLRPPIRAQCCSMDKFRAVLLLTLLTATCLAAPDSGLDDYWEDDSAEISATAPAGTQQSQSQSAADTTAKPAEPAPSRYQASRPSRSLLLQALDNTHPLREGVALILVLLFVINIFTGRQANYKLALAWAKAFCEEDGILDRNFAQLGFSGDNGELKSVLVRESASSFKMYATGRRFCHSLTATLELRKRHDLLSYAVSLFSPSDDELNVEVEMNESSMPPLVLAVAPPKTIRSMLKDEDNKELEELTKKIEVGRDRIPSWPSDKLSVLAEHSSTLYDLLSHDLIDQVFGKAAFETQGRYFQSLFFTSERSKGHKLLLKFSLTLPPEAQMEELSRWMSAVMVFIDAVGTYKLSSEQTKRAQKARQDLQNKVWKDTERDRQQTMEDRKEAKRKEEQEKLRKMDPEARARLQERKHRIEQKRANRGKIVKM
ncbi:hypothetical protein WJX73_010422 [Symbiochloris irregularis]|uniref:JmjC domain-containing protein n=1 Tax=Symbiochloris irregularis TaxID=706552 RepID=A0AAW1PP85_9CHLO